MQADAELAELLEHSGSNCFNATIRYLEARHNDAMRSCTRYEDIELYRQQGRAKELERLINALSRSKDNF